MNRVIDYNFELSKSVKNKIEEISNELERNIVMTIDDDIALLSEAWSSDSFDNFYVKLKAFEKNVSLIKGEMDSACEDIEKLSKLMYMTEQEAEKTAVERKQ